MTGVAIATPTLGQVAVEYNDAFVESCFHCYNADIRIVNLKVLGCPYIHFAMNRLVRGFLNLPTEFDSIFFIDDDLGWPPKKLVEFVQRPEDVICGIYPVKHDKGHFYFTPKLDANGEQVVKDGLWGAEGITGGFMRVKRRVIEQLAYDSAWYIDDDDGVPNPAVFEAPCGPDEKAWSQDALFAKKWLERGGEIWVDPTVRFSHRGVKVWWGTLEEFVEKQRSENRRDDSH